MKFSLTIESDNAAFENDPQGEISRILRELHDEIDSGYAPEIVRDYNGNIVGTVKYS